MVWSGVIGVNKIGPYFFDGNVTGESYLDMLQNFVLPRLNELNYNLQEIMFQQDGAPPHYSRGVTAWLNANLPRWIGRRGPIHWPA